MSLIPAVDIQVAPPPLGQTVVQIYCQKSMKGKLIWALCVKGWGLGFEFGIWNYKQAKNVKSVRD